MGSTLKDKTAAAAAAGVSEDDACYNQWFILKRERAEKGVKGVGKPLRMWSKGRDLAKTRPEEWPLSS